MKGAGDSCFCGLGVDADVAEVDRLELQQASSTDNKLYSNALDKIDFTFAPSVDF
jgi:hypothetical protein